MTEPAVPDSSLTSDEVDLEAPEPDVLEQRAAIDDEEPTGPVRTQPPLEADPADTVEQDAVVDLDEDDYR